MPNHIHEPVDVLVVGAGTAGCVLASRLSEDPDRRVLLLEAGPEADAGGDMQWGLTATVCGDRQGNYVRGKVVGGSGQINDGGLLRALPADFARWSKAGLPEWSWEQVLPAYRRYEGDADFGDSAHHGQSGPVPVVRAEAAEFTTATRAFAGALAEAGHPWVDDLNAPGAVGVGPYPKNLLGSELMSSVRTHLDPARKRPNLTVRASSPVDRVVVRGGRAVGVEVAGCLVRADEVVLAAGAPLSPVLLLRSGIGPADGLRRCGIEPVLDLPGVGQGLRDQPGAVVAVVPREGLLAADEPRHQVIARLASFPGHEPDDAFYCCQFAGAPQGGNLGLALMVGDLAPRSTGVVRLDPADPSGPPQIDLGFYREPGDLARMRAGVRHARDLTRTAAYADVLGGVVHPGPGVFDDDAALDGFLLAETFSRLATSGGAVMGTGSDAVVDQLLRVHGIEGLRVADLSVVPVPLRSPTAAEALMIGERAATLMRD